MKPEWEKIYDECNEMYEDKWDMGYIFRFIIGALTASVFIYWLFFYGQ